MQQLRNIRATRRNLTAAEAAKSAEPGDTVDPAVLPMQHAMDGGYGQQTSAEPYAGQPSGQPNGQPNGQPAGPPSWQPGQPAEWPGVAQPGQPQPGQPQPGQPQPPFYVQPGQPGQPAMSPAPPVATPPFPAQPGTAFAVPAMPYIPALPAMHALQLQGMAVPDLYRLVAQVANSCRIPGQQFYLVELSETQISPQVHEFSAVEELVQAIKERLGQRVYLQLFCGFRLHVTPGANNRQLVTPFGRMPLQTEITESVDDTGWLGDDEKASDSESLAARFPNPAGLRPDNLPAPPGPPGAPPPGMGPSDYPV